MTSFVDLLFILLFSTLILLSQSVQIGAIKTAPARVGSGGISEFKMDDVVILSVHGDFMELSFPKIKKVVKITSTNELMNQLSSQDCLVLVAGDEDISHQKIMTCWDQCRQAGINVRLGAEPEKNKKKGAGDV